MIPRWSFAASVAVIAASAALGWFVYPQLPEQIAAHWDIHGRVIGTMPKAAGVAALPLIALIALLRCNGAHRASARIPCYAEESPGICRV